jgi:hypothetical protein
MIEMPIFVSFWSLRSSCDAIGPAAFRAGHACAVNGQREPLTMRPFHDHIDVAYLRRFRRSALQQRTLFYSAHM